MHAPVASSPTAAPLPRSAVHEAHDGHRHGPGEGHADGAAHRHGGAEKAPLRIGASVLRLSLGQRLVIAALLLVPLWLSVALVAG